MSEYQADDEISPETYEFALLQRLKHEFEPQGLKVCGTENGKEHYVRGRFSLIRRQLDIAVYRPGENIPFLVADAKRHGNRIYVKQVETFIGMLEDVNASIGLLVAPLQDSGIFIVNRRLGHDSLLLRIIHDNELRKERITLVNVILMSFLGSIVGESPGIARGISPGAQILGNVRETGYGKLKTVTISPSFL